MRALGLYREEAFADNGGHQPPSLQLERDASAYQWKNLMRLVTYRADVVAAARLGALVGRPVVDLACSARAPAVSLPAAMLEFIDLGPRP